MVNYDDTLPSGGDAFKFTRVSITWLAGNPPFRFWLFYLSAPRRPNVVVSVLEFYFLEY
jgi:hypothetical protein